MPQPQVSRFRRAALAVKQEAVYGTDPGLASADIIEIRNVVYAGPQESSRDERISGLGVDLPDIPGSRFATISGEAYLCGAGVAYAAGVKPKVDAILRALGFQATGDFTGGAEEWEYRRRIGPTFGESATAALFAENAPQGKVVGSFGTYRLLHRRGQATVLAFTLTGLYSKPTDVALITAAPSSVQPPVFHDAAVTVDGVLHQVEMLDIDGGNDVQLLPGANAQQGYRGVIIAGHRSTIALDPEVVPIATFDWFDRRDKGTLFAASWRTGLTQYNRVNETVEKMQVLDVTESQRNGIRIYNVAGKLNAGAIVADQSAEHVITFN